MTDKPTPKNPANTTPGPDHTASASASKGNAAANIAKAEGASGKAQQGAAEALKRTRSSTAKAAGTILDTSSSAGDKARAGVSAGAGAAAAAAVSATGVGAAGSKVAAEAASTVTSHALKGNRWKLILAAALLVAFLPQFIVIGVGTVVVTTVASTMLNDKGGDAACMPGGNTGTLVDGEIPWQVWSYFRTAGYTPEQTAGIMGNIYRESAMNPFAGQGNAQPRPGVGYGLVQWTDEARQQPLKEKIISQLGEKFWWSAPNFTQVPTDKFSKDEIDEMLKLQLEHVVHELSSNEKLAGDKIRAETTIEGATHAWNRYYERSGDWYGDSSYAKGARAERLEWAKKYYDEFSDKKVDEDSSSNDEDSKEESDDPNDLLLDNISGGGGEAEAAEKIKDEAENLAAIPDPCAGGSPTGEAGTLTPCENGDPNCINMAYLLQDSSNMKCPEGTKDAGTETGYYHNRAIPIRLCQITDYISSSNGPLLVNATIAPAFVGFLREMEEAGYPVYVSSSFRTMAKQQQLYANSPGGAARPGFSNHQMGAAIDLGDFPAAYTRHNCGGHTEERSCMYPGSGAQMERWKTAYSIGKKYGLYFHDEEFWHLEGTVTGIDTGRDRGPLYTPDGG